MNPIGRLDLGSGGAISSRMASNTTLNCASYFLSSAASLRARSALETSRARRRTKARMISMLTRTARLLRSTEESMATPCSVKAYGGYLTCAPRRSRSWPEFSKVTFCDLKRPTSSHARGNMKSAGKRSRLRLCQNHVQHDPVTAHEHDACIDAVCDLWPCFHDTISHPHPSRLR